MDNNVVLTTFTSSAISVTVINWLKSSKYFPWITKEKITLLRVFSIIAAAASGVGINYVWSATDHSLLVSGLTAANGAAFAWTLLKHFAMNETIFQATKRPGTMKAIPPPAPPVPPNVPH
jgi:hypothetical protein